MVDLTDFIGASTPKKGPSCTAGRELESLDDHHADVLRAALADERVTNVAITQITDSDAWPGGRIAAGTVSRHRHGQCMCPST